MCATGGEEQQLTRLFVVHRRNHGYVGQMRAAAIRIIRDENVARFDPRIVGDNSLDRFAHRPQVNRNVRCVDD